MVDTRTEMRYNGLASGEALRNAQTIPHKFGEKGEYTHMKRKSAIAAVTAAALALSLAACGGAASTSTAASASASASGSSFFPADEKQYLSGKFHLQTDN